MKRSECVQLHSSKELNLPEKAILEVKIFTSSNGIKGRRAKPHLTPPRGIKEDTKKRKRQAIGPLGKNQRTMDDFIFHMDDVEEPPTTVLVAEPRKTTPPKLLIEQAPSANGCSPPPPSPSAKPKLLRQRAGLNGSTARGRKKKTILLKRYLSLDEMRRDLTEKMSRKSANEILRKHRKNIIPLNLMEKFEKLWKAEYFHLEHVRKCMDKLLPHKAPNLHDETKDEMYMFITICAFNMKDYCTINPKLLRETIKEHHKAEPHHPEFEKWNKTKRISEVNLMEMAIDRLSRNLQANGGTYNIDQLEQYLPEFVHDHEKNLETYKEYSNSLRQLVKKEWENQQKEWEKAKKVGE